MIGKRLWPALLALLLLAGCAGNPLPAGMEEETLLSAGREVVLLVVEGEYEAVWDRLRQDVRDTVTAADIQALALRQTDGAGVYKQIENSMTTGQSNGGEACGVAVFYCEYAKDDVLFRVAFDQDMTLIGLEITKQ